MHLVPVYGTNACVSKCLSLFYTNRTMYIKVCSPRQKCLYIKKNDNINNIMAKDVSNALQGVLF
jgi:hypothetical protein